MTTATPTPERMRQSVAPFLAFFGGQFARLNTEPDVANFAVGNPQEMPLPAYVDALQHHLVPQDKDWFAYKLSEPASQRTVAETLRTRTGLDWDPADVAMTNEVLCKILCHNICCLIQAMYELGIEPTFWGEP